MTQVMPGPHHFSHTSMATWRRCRYKYLLSYSNGFVPMPSRGYMRGTAGHKALETWYGNLIKIENPDYNAIAEKAIQAAADVFNNYEIEMEINLEEDWDLLNDVLWQYFGWAVESDRFKVVAVEKKFNLKIGEAKFTGVIDGIVEQGGSLWLLEHKFAKQARKDHIDLDTQVSIYMLAARLLGFNVRGTIYNIIRLSTGPTAQRDPVLRMQVYRNQEGLNAVYQELSLQLKEMLEFHQKGGRVYRNITRDCSWDCPYYNVCLSINDSGEGESVLRTIPLLPFDNREGDNLDDTSEEE